MRPLTRIQPQLPPQSRKTYGISAPAATHFRRATCAEVDCTHYLRGWKTTVDESTDLGQKQAHYIRRESRRGHTESRTAAGLTEFLFEAGQRCFRPHQVRVDRPEIYVVRQGDWRSYGDRRRHTRAEDWVEDFSEHQDRLADRLRRG